MKIRLVMLEWNSGGESFQLGNLKTIIVSKNPLIKISSMIYWSCCLGENDPKEYWSIRAESERMIPLLLTRGSLIGSVGECVTAITFALGDATAVIHCTNTLGLKRMKEGGGGRGFLLLSQKFLILTVRTQLCTRQCLTFLSSLRENNNDPPCGVFRRGGLYEWMNDWLLCRFIDHWNDCTYQYLPPPPPPPLPLYTPLTRCTPGSKFDIFSLIVC